MTCMSKRTKKKMYYKFFIEVTDTATEQCSLCKERFQTQKLINDIKQDITLIMINSTFQIEHNDTLCMQKDSLVVSQDYWENKAMSKLLK